MKVAIPSLIAVLWITAQPGRAIADDWKPVSEKDGVRISVRPVEGSSIKEVRGEGDIDAPLDNISAVLGDVQSYPVLMPPTVEATELKRQGVDTAWFHMVIDPPMIFKRDYCIRMTLSHLPGGVFKSEWALDNSVCPAKAKNMVRIERNSGSWVLTPLPDGKRTHVVYQSHTDPGGAVPAWIVNRVTAQTIPKIFQSVRRAAVLPRYARK